MLPNKLFEYFCRSVDGENGGGVCKSVYNNKIIIMIIAAATSQCNSQISSALFCPMCCLGAAVPNQNAYKPCHCSLIAAVDLGFKFTIKWQGNLFCVFVS